MARPMDSCNTRGVKDKLRPFKSIDKTIDRLFKEPSVESIPLEPSKFVHIADMCCMSVTFKDTRTTTTIRLQY